MKTVKGGMMGNEINELILEITKNILRKLDTLGEEMKAGFKRMEAGFDKLEKRIEKIPNKLKKENINEKS